MVRPGGVRDVYALVALNVPQEIANQTKRTCSRKSLAHSNSVLLNSGTVRSIHKLGSKSIEIGEALNGRVLMITLSSDASLSLCNTRKNHRLSIVITVGTHSKRNLTRILVSLKHLVQTKNSIWRSLSDLHTHALIEYPTAAQREVAKERKTEGLRELMASIPLVEHFEICTSKHY